MLVLSGASGLVGRYLCDELISRQIPFKVLGRQPLADSRVPNIPFCFFDLSLPIQEFQLRSFLDGVDAFIHLAALMPHPSRKLIDYYLCNSVAPKGLFDLCSEAGVEHFIYLSGSNILKPIDGFVTSQSSYSVHLRQPPYLSSKIAGELLLLNSSSSIKLSVLRPSSVYGSGIRGGLFRNLYDSLICSSPFSLSCKGLWSADFIYAGDVAKAIVRLIEISSSGVVNIGSGLSSSALDVANKFLSILGADEDLIVLKSFDGQCDSIGSLPVVSSDEFYDLMGHAPLSLCEGLDHAFREYGLF